MHWSSLTYRLQFEFWFTGSPQQFVSQRFLRKSFSSFAFCTRHDCRRKFIFGPDPQTDRFGDPRLQKIVKYLFRVFAGHHIFSSRFIDLIINKPQKAHSAMPGVRKAPTGATRILTRRPRPRLRNQTRWTIESPTMTS
jgi:hypothetical protein